MSTKDILLARFRNRRRHSKPTTHVRLDISVSDDIARQLRIVRLATGQSVNLITNLAIRHALPMLMKDARTGHDEQSWQELLARFEELERS